ncbi:MAG: PEGA domain-containing protein [Vicinamibacterales bacterium]
MTSEGSLFDAHPAAFGRYPVLHQIGAGSMGPVFRAEDPDSQAPVAVKALAGLPSDRARAVAEALADLVAAELDLPGAARALAAGFQAPDPYIVTTFCPGQSLDVALREYGPAAILDALPRLEAVAGILDDAAVEGVWHGGLHPRDILVSADETWLAGLGIAQAVERAGVRLPVRRPCTAPEVAAGGPTSPAADQFALAAIAYEWLFGRRVAGPADEGFEAPALPGVAPDAVNGAFASALAADPAERFPSCRAFVQALSAAVEDQASARPAPRARKKGRTAPAPLPLDLDDEAAGPAILPDPPIVEVEPEDVADALRLDADVDAPGAPVPAAAGPVAWDDEPDEVEDDLALADPEPEPPPARSAEPPPGWDVDAPGFGGTGRGGDGFGWGAIVVALLLGVALGAAGMFVYAGRGVPAAAEGGVAAPDAAGPVEAPGASSGDLTEAPAGGPVPPAAAGAETVPPAATAPAAVAPAAPPAPQAPAPPVNPGRLLVRTTPAGAAVTIDGEAAGETPLTLRDLPLGTRTVRVSRAGYVPMERRVALTAARPSRSLELRLTAERPAAPAARPRAAAPAAPRATTGSLLVESRPTGATVMVNGRARGATPLTLDGLAPGRYTIRIERPGYRPWQTTADVTAGGRARVAASLQGGQAEE